VLLINFFFFGYLVSLSKRVLRNNCSRPRDDRELKDVLVVVLAIGLGLRGFRGLVEHDHTGIRDPRARRR